MESVGLVHTKPVRPVCHTGQTDMCLTGPTASFSEESLNRSPPPPSAVVVPEHSFAFPRPVELSPTSLCETLPFGARSLCWVERFECVSTRRAILSLEHFGLRQATREAFVTLGGEAS